MQTPDSQLVDATTTKLISLAKSNQLPRFRSYCYTAFSMCTSRLQRFSLGTLVKFLWKRNFYNSINSTVKEAWRLSTECFNVNALMSDVVGAFSAIVAILRSLTFLIPVLDSTYPTGTTNDNKRLGTANWRATRRTAVSVSRPVVFQRDYEAAMQI